MYYKQHKTTVRKIIRSHIVEYPRSYTVGVISLTLSNESVVALLGIARFHDNLVFSYEFPYSVYKSVSKFFMIV